MNPYKTVKGVKIGVRLLRRFEAVTAKIEEDLLKNKEYESIVSGYLNKMGDQALAAHPLYMKWRRISAACTGRLMMSYIDALWRKDKKTASYIDKHLILPLIKEANGGSVRGRSSQWLIRVLQKHLDV